MLLEAGWGSYLANYANDAPRIDGLHNPALISVLEQTGVASARSPVPFNGGIPNLIYRFDNPLGGGFQHHQIGTLANLRASISYITGAHNMKFGYRAASATRARPTTTSRRSCSIGSTAASPTS